jgi:MFS family permease
VTSGAARPSRPGWKPSAPSLVLFLLCLMYFFTYVDRVIWAVPMDIAPQYSGTASGLMNTGSAVAAIFSPWAGGYLVQATGDNWAAPFYVAIALLIVGVGLSFTMHPDRKFVERSGAGGSAPRGIDEPEVALPAARQVAPDKPR